MSIDFSAVRVVQCVGECMVEMRRTGPDSASIAYSGDTFNTAVYLSRIARQLGLTIDVRYLSGVGDDDESRLLRQQWELEGVSDDSSVVAGHSPGVYLIKTDASGERSFTYWRRESAAAVLFSGTDWIANLRGDLIYLSGITLQLMTAEARRALAVRLEEVRHDGTLVAFDSNYRPRGWPGRAEARAATESLMRLCDVALVTLEDEIALGAAVDLASCAQRLKSSGIAEAVIKTGVDGAWVRSDGELLHVPTKRVEPIDTTAAGDSFNGAYLAARTAKVAPTDAAVIANSTARAVVRHPGAIIPPDKMPRTVGDVDGTARYRPSRDP